MNIQDIRRKNDKSPVAKHMLDNDHELDEKSSKLLIREPRLYYRKFKEAIFISNVKQKMNISKGVAVNPIWCSTFGSFLNYSQ